MRGKKKHKKLEEQWDEETKMKKKNFVNLILYLKRDKINMNFMNDNDFIKEKI